MLTKNQIKLIRSLQLKKNRISEGCFLVEGTKTVRETLNSPLKIRFLVSTHEFLEQNSDLKGQVETVSPSELSRLSSFKSSNSILAVVEMPEEPQLAPGREYVLALDGISDPGNLGTIIRTADWYGINKVVCSPDTVDLYNPKVISATMGSFTRVSVAYRALEKFLHDPGVPVYGALLEGRNIHDVRFAEAGVIVIGSESHGIRSSLSPYIDHGIHIPSYGKAESLNAAIATAVVFDNLRRGQ